MKILSKLALIPKTPSALVQTMATSATSITLATSVTSANVRQAQFGAKLRSCRGSLEQRLEDAVSF